MLRAAYDAARVLGWQLLPQSAQNARNRATLDRFVVPWEALASRRQPFRHRLFFTHIPKTGGTTLEHLIAKNHPPNGTLMINSEVFRRHPAVFARFGGMPRVVMGHHKLNQAIYQFIRHRVAHITIVREPVARVLSHFDYLRESPNHRMHMQARELTVEDFASGHLSPEVANGQTLRLAGCLPRRISKRTNIDPAALEVAKENLAKRFSFFGVTEQYAAFQIMAAMLLGWEDPFAQKRNVSEKRTRASDVPESVLATIRERNGLDLALYDFAVELFGNRCAEVRITAERIAAFEESQRQHQALLNLSGLGAGGLQEARQPSHRARGS